MPAAAEVLRKLRRFDGLAAFMAGFYRILDQWSVISFDDRERQSGRESGGQHGHADPFGLTNPLPLYASLRLTSAVNSYQ
jgi:hypothetical protein